MTNEDKNDAISLLREAKEKVEEAAYLMQQVGEIVKGLPTGYNMEGNIEVYVINYLTDGVGSISDKIDEYIEKLEQLGEVEEEGE